MAVFPPNLHYLKSLNGEGRFGTIYKERSYVVTFVSSEHILYVARNISKDTKIDISGYKPSTTKLMSGNKQKQEIEITMDGGVKINFDKIVTRDWEWIIETEPTQKIFALPLAYNIGLIVPYKKVDESENLMTFEGYVIDPIYNTEFFRQGISQIDI